MKFEFSIKQALKDSWALFLKNPAVLIGLTIIMAVFSYASNKVQGTDMDTINIPLFVGTLFISIIWTYLWHSVALAVVDKKEELVGYKTLHQHLPTFRQFSVLASIGIVAIASIVIVAILGTALVTAVALLSGGNTVIVITTTIILVLAFFVALVYCGTRLLFITVTLVDRNGGFAQTIQYSWKLVSGTKFWTAFLVLIITVILTVIGAIFFGIGLLITYPITALLMVKLYRALTLDHEEQSIIVQPQELL